MKILSINGAMAFSFLLKLIAPNVKVLCAVGDFGDGTFNLPQMTDSSTNVQLTKSAPIAQNTCYALFFCNGNQLDKKIFYRKVYFYLVVNTESCIFVLYKTR